MAPSQQFAPAVDAPHPFGWNDSMRWSFLETGYLVFKSAIDPRRLTVLNGEILAAFERAKKNGELFRGGGTRSGHVNCFPGEASRFVMEAFRDLGILSIVHTLSRTELRAPNVGCNLNLPGSHPQNDHVDGYAEAPFLIANIAVVDTDATNGAMEILPGTHGRHFKYWQLLLDRPERVRLCLQQGDVVIRTSALWHRGMPNRSTRARPMLAFTWEDGGSTASDPYRAHSGRIAFLPNRYPTDWKGQLKERAFVAAPRVASTLRAIRSIF